MSRFYGTVTGQARTTATRRGSAAKGLRTTCAGWDIGVECYAFDAEGKDRIAVVMDGGSNGAHERVTLGYIQQTDKGPVWQPK